MARPECTLDRPVQVCLLIASWTAMSLGTAAQVQPAAERESELLQRAEGRLRTIEDRLGHAAPARGEDRIDILTRILGRLDRIESSLAQQEVQEVERNLEVVLEDELVLPDRGQLAQHPLARPWFENFRITGFLSARALFGGEATEPEDFAFYLDQLHLELEADVWEDTSVFLELIAARRPPSSNLVTTGEAFVRFDRVFGVDGLGAKVGRFDLPFGEEYLRRKAPANPLISFPAAIIYGWDEGVQLFGAVGGLHFAAAITDGEFDLSVDSNDSTAQTLKLWGEPTDWLYLSGSFHHTGSAHQTALCFGSVPFVPVGSLAPSTLGTSPTNKIDGCFFEFDARVAFSDSLRLESYAGLGLLDDDADEFSRDLYWYQLLCAWDPLDELTLLLRISEFGSLEDDEGYILPGGRLGNGSALGFDAHRHRRIALAANWRVNQRTIFKAEFGWDRYALIASSALDANNDGRWFSGLELTVIF